MTHDYKRNGTTTLFAALNVLDGTVIGRNMQRHRHQEFIRFLNRSRRRCRRGKVVHVVLDNYATHKHPKVRAWLGAASPLDLPLHADLGLVAERGRGLLRQADQASPQTRRVPLPRRAAGPINRFVAETNAEPKPFVWTADPDVSSPLSIAGSKR